MKRIIIALLVLLVAMPSVFGIGIAPTKREIDFTPAIQKIVTFRIINNENKDMKAAVIFRGELEKYVSTDSQLIEIKANEPSKDFNVKVNMPQSFEKPGIHTAEVVVVESKGEASKGVSAVGAVVGEVIVMVSFPKKYLQSEMYLESGNVVDFIFVVHNSGTENINTVKANIEILNANYEKVAMIETPILSLSKGEENKLKAMWKGDANKGLYRAVAKIIYDDNIIMFERNFTLGEKNIKINDIKVEDFKLGKIAKFDLLIESEWGDEIKDIYADVLIKDEKGQTRGNIKTANINLDSYSNGTLNAYWITKDVLAGTYFVFITLDYASKQSENVFEVYVSSNSIKRKFTPTGQVVASTAKTDSIYLFILVLLVLSNIIWYIYAKKLKKKRR